MSKKIALIDGYGFVFRAYHSLPPLTRSDSTPVGAVYGFTNMLLKLLASLDVSHIAVVFDSGSKTFRNEIYPDYKANRPPCPEDLIPQFPIVREAAESLNLAILEKTGFEADDIIATLAKKYSNENFEVIIVSSDKDLMQLVDEKVLMYDAMKNKMIGKNEVREKFFVNPNQVLDVLSLIGDSSDNVPGVKGIGPKNAAELVEEFGCLENIFNNLEKMKPSKRKEYLENGKEKAILSKNLIKLKDDVELGIDENYLKIKNINPYKLVKFLQQQGFRSLVERVKKDFNLNEEKNNDEKKEEKSFETKKILFDEIKKIKIENEKEFNQVLEKINKNQVAIFDFEENFTNLENLTLSTIDEDKNIKEIFYLELNLTQKTNSENKIDLFNFNTKQISGNEISLDFLQEKIKEILISDSIKKIFFDAKRFFRLYLNTYENPLEIRLEAFSFEDVSLINHLLNSSIKNDFRELVDFNLEENFELKNYGEIYDELKKSKTPQSLENKEEKLKYYCFRNYCLWQIYKILSPKVLTQKLNNSYFSYEKPLLSVLARIENEGVKIDTQKLAILSKEFEEKILQLTKEIYQIAGCEFNIASTQQLSDVLFNKLNLTSTKKSKKTGALSTKSSVLEELAEEGHDIAEKVLDFRKYSKLKNTYTDALPKEINIKTGRIHTNFSTITTITGRLASSNPNLQNIPIKSEDGRKIREAFVAKQGCLLLSADYSQIELRVIAHIAKIENLIKAFHEDKDIHKITASQVFGIPENEITNELRSKAKAINFGIIYGISAFGLARQLKISRSEASDYIKSYLATYPGIDLYMKNYIDFARKNGFVETIGGRKCFIQHINDKNPIIRAEAERLAINAPIQGSAADIIKKAMIKIDKKLFDKKLKSKMILQIHDELIIESYEDEIDEIKKIIKTEMENAMNLDVLLKVDVEIGKSWR